MAKRSKRSKKRKINNKPRQAKAKPAPAPEVMAAKAEKDLEEGNYRRAREGFRRLVKHDLAAYGPRYLEATRYYAKEAIRQGRFGQAEEMVEQARRLVGEEAEVLLDWVRLRRAINKGDWQAAAAHAVKQFQPCLLAADAMIVDALVLSFQPTEGLPEELASEIGSMHEALEALGRGDHEAVEQALRPLGRQSPLARWKILMKCLLAYHSGNRDRALQGFERLAGGGTVPERAAAAYLNVENETAPLSDLGMQLGLHLLGESASISVITRAALEWNRNARLKAYNVLHEELPDFPNPTRVGLAGQLTNLILHPASMNQPAHRAVIEGLSVRMQRSDFRSDGEELTLLQLGALTMNPEEFPADSVRQWEKFLTAYQSRYGENRALVCQAYFKAARELFDYVFDREPSRHQAKMILPSLEKAQEADPEWVDPYLLMLDVYAAAGMNKEENKLLEKLTGFFPREKKFLVRAGKRCVERGATVKGLKMLREAYERDASDREAHRELMKGLFMHALQYGKKGQEAKCDAAFDEMFSICSEDAGDFDCGRPYIYLNQAVCAGMYYRSGQDYDKSISKALESLHPHLVMYAVPLLSDLHMARVRSMSGKRLVMDDLGEFGGREANGTCAVCMLRMLIHFRSRMEEFRYDGQAAKLYRYLQDVYEMENLEVKDARALYELQSDTNLQIERPRIVEIMKRRCPEDLFFAIAALEFVPPYKVGPKEEKSLEKMLEKARASQDLQALALGERLSKCWEMLNDDVFLPDMPFAHFMDDEDEEKEENEVFDALEELEARLPGTKDLLRRLALSNPREREAIRKEAGIPKRDFSGFVDLAESLLEVGYFDDEERHEDPFKPFLEENTPKARPRAKKRPASAPKSSPIQLDLFS